MEKQTMIAGKTVKELIDLWAEVNKEKEAWVWSLRQIARWLEGSAPEYLRFRMENEAYKEIETCLEKIGIVKKPYPGGWGYKIDAHVKYFAKWADSYFGFIESCGRLIKKEDMMVNLHDTIGGLTWTNARFRKCLKEWCVTNEYRYNHNGGRIIQKIDGKVCELIIVEQK